MPIITPEYNLYNWSDLNFPTIEPSLKLDFANARALDPRITFERASTATYVGRDGLIKTAGEDEARFDHDPTTGESLGLLIEESRTNLLSYSDLTSGASGSWWINGGPTVSQGSNVTAPDGTLTAWNTVYNGASGDGNLYRGSGEVTTTNSTSYTISVWAKANPSNTYIAGIAIRTFNDDHRVNFNLLTGSYISLTEGSPTDHSIIPYPNGWYRCSMTFTSGTDGNQGVQFYLVTSTGSTSLNSAGANGEEIYMWGAQMEAGTFPTSYIPTSGSTATRAVDTAQINRIQFHNPSEFVLYAAGRSNTGASDTSSSATGCLVSLGDTTNDYRFMLRKYRYNPGGGVNTGFTFRYRNVNDGINMDMFPNYYDGLADGYDTTTIAPIWDDFNIHRSALAFEAGVSTDNIRGCADGTLVVPAVTTPGSYSTVSNPTPYIQATTLEIGSGASAGPFNGTISEVRYYPKRLTNAQLQTLTQ